MADIVAWLKKTVENVIDPDRETRVQTLTAVIQNALNKQRRAFSLDSVLQGHEYSESDLKLAKECVYRAALERAWSDGEFTENEQSVARWVAAALVIPQGERQRINCEYAQSEFGVALARAMEDGILDAEEEARLAQIAAVVGTTLSRFARAYFQEEGESFLRGIFLACVADGSVSDSEWGYLLTVAEKLGISREEVRLAIQPQARQFVEHVLADAKSDGRLSEREEASLAWLSGNLGLPDKYWKYIRGEVQFLRMMTDIDEGRLPVISAPHGVETRAGEIIYFSGNGIWRHTRLLKSGPRSDDHSGVITLSDNRLIFSSSTKSQTFKYRKIVSHSGSQHWIELQVEGKPASVFFLETPSPIPYAIFSSAVAMANQTKTARIEGAPTRHIPRDVRQRVWQRYGGRCAECGAGDYLEFDHIVPVAKGGSNSDANVQLLCRRCNLKKSDHI